MHPLPDPSPRQVETAARRLAFGDPVEVAAARARMRPADLVLLRDHDPCFKALVAEIRRVLDLPLPAYEAQVRRELRLATLQALQDGRVTTVNLLLRASRLPAGAPAGKAAATAEAPPDPLAAAAAAWPDAEVAAYNLDAGGHGDVYDRALGAFRAPTAEERAAAVAHLDAVLERLAPYQGVVGRDPMPVVPWPPPGRDGEDEDPPAPPPDAAAPGDAGHGDLRWGAGAPAGG
jgi:hypothetical protein